MSRDGFLRVVRVPKASKRLKSHPRTEICSTRVRTVTQISKRNRQDGAILGSQSLARSLHTLVERSWRVCISSGIWNLPSLALSSLIQDFLSHCPSEDPKVQSEWFHRHQALDSRVPTAAVLLLCSAMLCSAEVGSRSLFRIRWITRSSGMQ